MSLTASYVIGIIALVRLFLKNAPKSVSYILWAVAGFRLVVPFSFESVFSLIPFKSTPIPADIAMQKIPRVDSGIIAVDHAVSRLLPAAMPEASANPLQLWQTAGTYLWLTGVAVMLIYSVVSIILLNRRLCGSMLSEENIYEAQNLKTPFVLGFIRPKIYIPIGLCAEERNYIILHEQTHIKRFDHVVKLFAFLVLCVHWFNPIVWVAFLLMSADMEMSCDERVLKEMGSDIKKAYSTSLLSMTTGRRLINSSPLAFGEGNIKGRIKNILNFKKPAVWIIAVSVILVVVLCIGLTANKANGKNPVSTDEIRVEVAGDIPGAVIDYAKEYVGQQVDYYNEVGKDPSAGMRTYTIIDAKITGLTEMNTGTAWENKAVSMWLLEYRLLPDNPGNVILAGGMQMEEIDGQSWLTEWGSTGQPYLLLESKYFNAELIWQPICVTNTDIIGIDYGTPEMVELYGNKYTAAAMELYNEIFGENSGAMNEISDKNAFNLTAEEQKVYDLFKINKDDALLKNLEPISIAKLYIQASLDEDYKTQYGLYFIEKLNEGQMGWTLEEHLKIPKKDRGSKESIYENLVPLVNGEFIMLDENKGYIEYQIVDEATSEILDMGFRMERGKNKIWKVSFMPIQ